MVSGESFIECGRARSHERDQSGTTRPLGSFGGSLRSQLGEDAVYGDGEYGEGDQASDCGD